MAQAYVDDHHVILYQTDKEARDITAFCSDLQLREELSALSREVSFAVFQNPYDKYVADLGLSAGDKIRIINQGGGQSTEIFAGIVSTVTLDGSVTAYDVGWYLNKSEIILQCTEAAAEDAIRQMCGKAGVAAGEICALPQKITKVWVGATPSSILEEILGICTAATGQAYHTYIKEGKLQVQTLPTEVTRVYHRPAKNLQAFDITWALGQISGEQSMESLYNAMVIAAEENGNVYIGALSSNADSIKRYGMQQHVESVSLGDNLTTAQLGAMAKNLLANADRVTQTRAIGEIWGADECESGVVLSFHSPAFGIQGKYRVTEVTHHYGGAGHTMELAITALEALRAAGDAADNITVHGLPAPSENAGGDMGEGNGSAAAFVAVARGEIGTTETPPGSKRNKYGAWQGNNGVDWCVQFVCYCGSKAGVLGMPRDYAGVSAMQSYYESRGKYRSRASGYLPQPGDLMIQGTRHIGIVESATASAVQTIEGNCTRMVKRMTRYYSEITGFCTPFAS